MSLNISFICEVSLIICFIFFKFLENNIIKAKKEIASLFKKYKKIDKLIEEITDTDSQISDKLFYNVKIIKHNKITVDRIEKFRIE